MRTHGWSGDPPATDEEAAARIVAAAIECVEESGGDADLAAVADRVGVTRQTVYRYFPSRLALFEAVAVQRVGSLIDRLAAHVDGLTDTTEAIVEVMLFCLRTLPEDPQLAFIAQPGRADALIMRPDAPQLSAVILRSLPIDIGSLDDDGFATLSEHMVRLMQSLLLDPATAVRGDDDLRAFLHACLDHHVRPGVSRPEAVTARRA